MTAATDQRFMAAAIRLSRRHLGLTGANPSVATLIVRDDGEGPAIIGRGVTAIGGRPHAETIALDEAGARARGATAYVTLEPCAHHGRTPPCAEALVTAGIVRVVGAASDPDERVSGKGYAILRRAGLKVSRQVCAALAEDVMSGYLIRAHRKRPEVILKLAVSADGFIGRRGEGQVAVTGEVARSQSYLLRAACNAILVGIGTALADDPELTCRLPGLRSRSPVRIVLDRMARLPLTGRLAKSARETPVWVAVSANAPRDRVAALQVAGCQILATEIHEGKIALPEFLEDLGSRGILRLLVEGGAMVARSFLDQGLADRLVLFNSSSPMQGRGKIASPVTMTNLPAGFKLLRQSDFDGGICAEYARTH